MKRAWKKCLTLIFFCTVSWLILSIYKINNFELLVGTNDLTSEFDSQIRIPIFSTDIQNVKRFLRKELTKGKGIANRTLYKGMNISTEFEYFYRNVSEDKLENPLLHRHQYRTLLNNETKCKGKDVLLLVFVHSSSEKSLARQQIRSTYGSISDYENEHIAYVFVLGQTPKQKIQQRINDESEKYMDIVQGNFVDSYRNLTYKRVFSLFWVNNFCSNAKFVVKVDDDVIINIPLLIQHLRQKTKKNLITNVLECNMLTDTKPLRHKNSKWRTSLLEYRYPTFPPYCDGFSSIMSIDVVRKMYDTTKEVPFLWLEDVYGGGFLPWILNIEMHQPYCYSTYVEGGNWNCKLFVRAFMSNALFKNDIWEHFKHNNVPCKC
ncbi:beta-1,3-galactosyltransferase 5-like [Mytilus trossulus]|uniref:beta-1,3-galactosyltransferase 5-like n=1 Tax=Mytilus trossulus TaxID=6551 RepID=UPI0030049833